MKIVSIGVGEAFDERYYNNSHLVVSNENVILLDCGYAIPNQIWKYYPDVSFIDSIFISHLHADHCFGLPPLIVRMREEKRRKPLTIISMNNEKLKQIIKNGYPKALDNSPFEIEFIEAKPSKKIRCHTMDLTFASTSHSIPNLAVRISNGKNIICYSGDGRHTDESKELYENADLLIHECYKIEESMKYHSSLTDLISLVSNQNIKHLFLTHIQRNSREKMVKYIQTKKYRNISIPNPMNIYLLE